MAASEHQTTAAHEHPPMDPGAILQLGLGFWASKTLLSAVELGLFTALAAGPRDGESLAVELGLHPRASRDFLDALVALGMLTRTGGIYANTPQTDVFLDRGKPAYVGGMLEMANARLYPYWGNLTEALQTGEPQNEAKVGEDFFGKLYADPDALRQFLHAMSGVSAGAAMAMAQAFPFERHQTLLDVGCAEGALLVHVARAHPHLSGIGLDLPPVQGPFDEHVAQAGLQDRLRFVPGDFFTDAPLPAADVITMGHILHDWNLEEKKALLAKAYDALPEGGALVVYEAMIDDDRSENAFGLLMSLNMLIETSGGFDYTGADCRGWMAEAGFRETSVAHLVGPDSMVVAIK